MVPPCQLFICQGIKWAVLLFSKYCRTSVKRPLSGTRQLTLNRGGRLIEVHPKTTLGDVQLSVNLSNISTNECNWRKSRKMMDLRPSITCTKAKETITFHSFTFIWLKTYNFVSSWPFNRGMKQNQITLGTARSWPQPLNRGGRWIEVFITVYSSQFFRDFGLQQYKGDLARKNPRAAIFVLVFWVLNLAPLSCVLLTRDARWWSTPRVGELMVSFGLCRRQLYSWQVQPRRTSQSGRILT